MRWKSIGQIVFIAAPIMIIACTVIAISVGRMRQNMVADAQRANDTMAAILSQQVSQSVQAIDLVLGDLVARAEVPAIINDDDLRRDLGTKSTYDFLVDRLGHLPQADVIAVLDGSGRLVATSRAWPSAGTDLSGDKHFQYLKQHADLSLLIGADQLNVITGQRIVYFSRRLENRNGEFMGVASVGVSPEFFLRFYDGISTIPGAFVRLLRPNGSILVTYPDKAVRTKLSENSEWQELVKRGGGHFRSAGFMHEIRLVAVRPLERYQLVINAGVDESTVIELWRNRAMFVGLIGLAVALAVAALVCGLFLLYRRAKDAQLRFDSVLTNMKQAVAMFDRDDCIVIHNRSYADMYGLSSEAMPPGTALDTIIDLRLANGIYGGASREEYRQRHVTHFGAGVDTHHSELELLSDGRYVLLSHQPMAGGGWITTHEDVTERQQAAVQIAHMASHDSLTGLANRTQFLERVQAAAHLGKTRSAVLIIDLDEFKAVNDTFGHVVGDALLGAVAARLKSATKPEDVVARLGGDEFAILCPLAGSDLGSATDLAARLLTSIRERYHVEDRQVTIGLSIGIAMVNGDAADPRGVMRDADFALYRAKADGRNCVRLFDPAMAEEIQSRRELTVALDAALARGQLAVHYQPIVDAMSREAVAMEALARWCHPLRGNIAPDVFIPLAEEAGLIARLGAFVLEEACRDAMTWPTTVKVSVNVSAIQLTRNDLVATVQRALAKTGLPARRLQIEITESVLLGNSDHTLAVLQELRDAGVTIVLDDFGTGFSSLGYLNRFPLDKIKIDRSFVERLGADAGSAAIVAAVISIGHAFRALTTAEGVETEDQYLLLRTTAVAEMQGYLFGRPMPAHAWSFQGRRAVLGAVSLADAVAA